MDMDNQKISSSQKQPIIKTVWQLLGDACHLFEKKFLQLILLAFIGAITAIVSSVVITFCIGFFVNLLSSFTIAKLSLAFLLFVLSVILILFQILITIALLIVAAAKDSLDFNKIFFLSFKKLSSFIWVVFLSLAVITTGLALFIIPGIIAAVWFSLAGVIAVIEDKKGWSALLISKEFIKGHWWQTTLFLIFVLFIISSAITIIDLFKLPSILQILLLNTLIGAFCAAAIVALYNHLSLRQEMAVDLSKQRIRRYSFFTFVGAALIILIVGLTIFTVVKFKNDILRFIEAQMLQEALIQYQQKQGLFPEKLDQLVPDYLPSLPSDPANNEQFYYLPVDDYKDYNLIINFDKLPLKTFTSKTILPPN